MELEESEWLGNAVRKAIWNRDEVDVAVIVCSELTVLDWPAVRV
jgi:hypothetical protein